MTEKLLHELKQIKKDCYRVKISKPGFAPQMADNIRFAGPGYAETPEEKPVCPDCGNDLSFIFQFYAEFDKNNAPVGPLYVFYYCFKCMPIGRREEEEGQWALKVYQKPSLDQFFNGSGIDEDLVPCSTSLIRTSVLPDYETIENDFPQIAALCEEIDAEDPVSAYEDVGQEAGCYMEPFTSIGGFPKWIQGESIPECPKCKKNMYLFSQIDSEPEAKLMWGDAGCVYIFRCDDHPEEFAMEMQCF